jgi:uncharacterized protein (TIGR00369 family)
MTESAAHGLAGIDYLRALIRDELPHPSMAYTLGFRLTEVDEGRAVISGETQADYCNPNGTIHGAWAAALLDSCMGSSVHSLLPAGVGFTIVEFKIDFVRPITVKTGKVRAEGTIVKVGKKIGMAEGALRDGAGKVLAKGTTTCLIFRPSA